jgi:hypothetical protein
MAMPSAAAAGDLGLQVGMHPSDDQERPRLLGGKSVGDGAATLNDQPISSATPAPRVPLAWIDRAYMRHDALALVRDPFSPLGPAPIG